MANKPVVGQSVLPTVKTEPGKQAKAAASKTNAGAVTVTPYPLLSPLPSEAVGNAFTQCLVRPAWEWVFDGENNPKIRDCKQVNMVYMNVMDKKTGFPKAVFTERLRLDLSQGQLGARLGVTKQTIWRWESGLHLPTAPMQTLFLDAIKRLKK